MGKWKLHYIKVLSDDDEIAQAPDSGKRNSEVEPPHLEIPKEKKLQEGVKGVTIATL
jgi:hypothetical protein